MDSLTPALHNSFIYAGVVELANAGDSKSPDPCGLGSSTLPAGTNTSKGLRPFKLQALTYCLGH